VVGVDLGVWAVSQPAGLVMLDMIKIHVGLSIHDRLTLLSARTVVIFLASEQHPFGW